MRQITRYTFDVPLKEIQPYIEPIKKYFGLNNTTLEDELSLLDGDPDRSFELDMYIRQTEIEDAFKESFPESSLTEQQTKFLWLVANLYFFKNSDNYEYARRYNSGDLEWYPLEQDLLKLYSFIEEHKQAGKVTIKIGKDSLLLDNDSGWFQSVFKKQVFPHCLPHIQSKEQAYSLTRGKRGRPVTRTKENAIVCGLAEYLADEGFIHERAPGSLLSFARKFLVMMWLIEEDDKIVDEDWIKSQITDHKKKGKDARFWTPKSEFINLEEYLNSPDDPMCWIF